MKFRKEMITMAILTLYSSAMKEHDNITKPAMDNTMGIIHKGINYSEAVKHPGFAKSGANKSSKAGRFAANIQAEYADLRQGLYIFEDSILVRIIPGRIVKSSWDPQSNRIAYLEADPKKKLYFEGRYLSIYDTITDSLDLIIDSEGEFLWEVVWAGFDGNLYVWTSSFKNGWRVQRVDLESKKLIPTQYRGIYFSPDGRFCLKPGWEGSETVLYRCDNNKVVWNSFESYHPYMGNFMGWGKSRKGETLLYLMDGQFNIGIVNCDTGELKFFKRPRQGVNPVFEGENVIWK